MRQGQSKFHIFNLLTLWLRFTVVINTRQLDQTTSILARVRAINRGGHLLNQTTTRMQLGFLHSNHKDGEACRPLTRSTLGGRCSPHKSTSAYAGKGQRTHQRNHEKKTFSVNVIVILPYHVRCTHQWVKKTGTNHYQWMVKPRLTVGKESSSPGEKRNEEEVTIQEPGRNSFVWKYLYEG